MIMNDSRIAEDVVVEDGNTQDYIAALKELKENTVSRDSYLKLKEENKKLINSLAAGETISMDAAPAKKDVSELMKTVVSDRATNLEVWTAALDLREQMIERGDKDPFLPTGHNIQATVDDIASVERVVEGITNCIDIADGNADVFNAELQRLMVDPVIPKVKTRRK